MPTLKATLATGAGLTLLATHFAMTALHVTPVNPLKVEHERLVTAWIGPVFEQNWKLFAPDPIAIDQGLLVRTRDVAGVEGSFVDVTTPFLEDKHHNLLPTRAGYQVSGVITRFIDARQTLLDATDADASEVGVFLTPEDLAGASPEDTATYREALRDLRDTARHHAGAREAAQVQLRLVQHVFPRYSDRADTGMGEISHSTSEWLDAHGAIS
ncbi:DUF5819 family protein [Sanguibacter sp. A247]|uniref:DUF5819 family protein n=1 Tax=unclassified Sanguibacter TaxID=2645534 RepID=UPI003FD8D5F8